MHQGSVLVVDDEPAILSTLKKALSLEGYSVDVAGGVKLAEERLAKRGYDIVLLDVGPLWMRKLDCSSQYGPDSFRHRRLVALVGRRTPPDR